MSVAEAMQENVNSRTVQLVKLLSEFGPDIPEISRRLGQFKESVRYRYKEKILSRGFVVQAAVDHERLGLRRVVLITEVSEEYRKYAGAIFSAMNELCYLVGFHRTLVGGEFILNLSVPRDKVNEIVAFFDTLKQKGMFTSVEVLEFDWVRVAPMKPEFYDFDTGRWDYEWKNAPGEDYKAVSFAPSEAVRFDLTDLLIIKELQMDANKSLKEISDKLQVNYKKLAWHYSSHVLGRKMLRGYNVKWMGTGYDYAIEKALHRKHKYFAVDLFVRNVSEYELMALRHSFDRLPFLWGEASGRNYFAELAIPVDYVVEGLQYLGDATNSVKDRMTIFPLDQTEAVNFTIPYPLFDPVLKRWIFNNEDLVKRFETLIMQIKTPS